MILRKHSAALLSVVFYWAAFGQIASGDKEVWVVPDPPPLRARTNDPRDVLAAALEMILRDKEVCCGKNSALEDTLERVDPESLQDIANKLQGRQLLSDGRPIHVSVVYLKPEQVSAGAMILKLRENHAALILWDSHLYVIDGMTYVESADSDGNLTYMVHKFAMQDPRYSDSRRKVTFDRVTQDASKVQGILFVHAALQ